MCAFWIIDFYIFSPSCYSMEPHLVISCLIHLEWFFAVLWLHFLFEVLITWKCHGLIFRFFNFCFWFFILGMKLSGLFIQNVYSLIAIFHPWGMYGWVDTSRGCAVANMIISQIIEKCVPFLCQVLIRWNFLCYLIRLFNPWFPVLILGEFMAE